MLEAFTYLSKSRLSSIHNMRATCITTCFLPNLNVTVPVLVHHRISTEVEASLNKLDLVPVDSE